MKSIFSLQPLFTVLLWLIGVTSVLAQPTLGIAPMGQQSVLYWTATPTNYFLQSATNLTTPDWVTANDAEPVTAVTVRNTSVERFFRLIYTNPPAGMALIPGGWFTMGSSSGNSDITDANPTNIYVSGFYMDVNLVSYGLWTNVYARATGNAYSFVNAGSGNGANYPVQTVDWYDCVKWCNARSQLTRLTPVYYTDADLTQVYKTGQTDAVYVNGAANGYRLPTEAEWEKAARGGLSGRRFPWGNRIDENQANYYGNTNSYYDLGPSGYNAAFANGGLPYTSPGGSFDVNGYGLYDMAGNVWEWCWDWYGTPYGQPTPANPTGPATGSYRVLRGGDWSFNALYARCAYRYGVVTISANYTVGFRCVRGL